MLENYSFLLRAVDFAAQAHRDQRRKGADASPYINHPVRVARLLVEEGGIDDEKILAAALLHDTVEDTAVTFDDLEKRFGRRVRSLVEEVTDDKSLPAAERKKRQVEHARELTAGAALIKLADKIDNIREIKGNPPADWNDERKEAYIRWGQNVVANLPVVDSSLLAIFKELTG